MRRGLTVRMVVADALLVTVVGTTFAFLLLAIAELRDSARLSRHARDGLIAADAIEKVVVDLETGVRGYVITGEERFLEPWNNARAALPAQARSLERLAGDSPDELGRTRQILQGVTSYVQEYATPLIDAVRSNDVASPRSVATTDEGKQRVDALRAQLDGLRTAQRARIAVRQQRADAAARRATVDGAAGLAGSILLVLIFTGYLTRVVVLPVRRAARMAGSLAGGDLEARLPETGAGEIGELEHAFNAMGGSLETSRDELTHLLEEQAALRRVATLVARGVRPPEIFSAVAEEVGRLLGADNAVVVRFAPDGTSTVVVGVGEDLEKAPVGTRWDLNDYFATTAVWRTGRSARVDDDRWRSASGPVADGRRRMEIRSEAASPIIVEGRLHDGTQQRLVSLGLELRLAQSTVPPDVPELRTEIGRVADELNEVVDDLREISRGIHPAILSEGGLGPALRTLARRAAIAVELDVTAVARLPEPIEVAAYYVVSEAITNTTRHASASVVHVSGEERDGSFHLSIRDDGVGGADPARGSGLIGLRDRAEALGGSIKVSSPAGEGTLILVELPLRLD